MLHINNEQWDEMVDLLEEDFSGLVREFIEDSQKSIDLIKVAQQNHDNKKGLESAHTLKGASSTLGAEILAHHCLTMQSVCYAKMIDAAHNVVHDIETEFAGLKDEINIRLTNLESLGQ